MAHISGSANLQIKKSENVLSDEQDCIPLKKRLKMLLSSKRLEKDNTVTPLPSTNVVVRKEDQQCESLKGHVMPDSSPASFAHERLLSEQGPSGIFREYGCQETQVNEIVRSDEIKINEVNGNTVLSEKVDVSASDLLQCSMLFNYPVKVEVDYADSSLMCSSGNGVENSRGNDLQAVKIKTEIAGDFVDDLDHMVLKERLKLLLSRKSLELTKPVPEGNCLSFPNSVLGDTIQLSCGIEKKDAESPISGNHSHHVPERNASDIHNTSKSGSSNGITIGSSCTVLRCSALMGSWQGMKSDKSGSFMGNQESDSECLSKKVSTINESCDGQDFVSGNPHNILSSALSSPFVNIKAEPLDYGYLRSLIKDVVCNFPSDSITPVKIEQEISEESNGDKVDHMLLRDRIQLLASRGAPNLDNSKNAGYLKKIMPSVLDCSPIISESAKPFRVNRPRKRRKTVTDSVETAMEEDAPGLLQVLIDKGVLVNEIKLYGETESNDALDDSFSEDSFSELEAVISKLFSQRQSLLKFAPIRCSKGEKARYCLACLISLVDQARYLQFRKWPVEWGWCRDLQSFIFVFERHNRIVLERPEYGYATYFFELVDSLPIDWQIKRLVTAMKLTSCSRITLIENKALLVGEDLTEGEARVLMEYGWLPDSGLGTMLNYCDRVVHDRRNERDSSEWSSKIGKLLMDGYNGGTIVSTDIPKKVVEYSGGQGPQIKLEL